MASPGPRLALDRLAGASSNLAAVAGGTSVDELRWRRGLLVRAQARAWGVEKGGGGVQARLERLLVLGTGGQCCGYGGFLWQRQLLPAVAVPG